MIHLSLDRAIADVKASVVTLSISVIIHFLANGPSIASMPRSVAYSMSLKRLPIDLPALPWPAIVSENDEKLCPRPA